MDYKNVISMLSAQSGPSGFEQAATHCAEKLLAPLVDEVWIDRMGNLCGLRRCGKPEAKRLLLDAHLDEIGFIVTGYEDGFLRFSTLGGVDPRMLPDRELTIMTEPPIYGVVACLPPHIQTAKDYNKSIPIKDMVIDVGLTQDAAQKLIPIGTPAVYREEVVMLGEKMISGKSLDDKACFAALLGAAELLKDQPLDVDLLIVGSTREEVNCGGATVAAWQFKPDFCVAVDVTHGSTPDAAKEKTFQLDKGPVIGMGPNCTKWMTQRLFDKAKQISMDVQTEVMAGHSGTNAWPMQISREGVATAVLSIPLRYMHTPIECVNLDDVEKTAQLLAEFVAQLGREGVTF